MSDLMLDVDQAGELKEAFRRGDWTKADVKRFSESDKDKMKRFRDVLLGRAVVSVIKHIIDCDAEPFCPKGWKVEEHRKGGQLEWDHSKAMLHLSPNQMDGKYIEGNKLRKELANMPVMNANVLDWYLAHPELIPDEWKGKVIFFWGTIYRLSDGLLYVRYLFWGDGEWFWSSDWLGFVWRGSNPAAVLA